MEGEFGRMSELEKKRTMVCRAKGIVTEIPKPQIMTQCGLVARISKG